MGGTSTSWIATPGSQAQAEALAREMRQARAAEYLALAAQAEAAERARPGERARWLKAPGLDVVLRGLSMVCDWS
ncbi:hypothetical protein ACIBEJ_24890 [Nonomuraea sp. NPDC050790]|uniref:hypothetical protein n=1 Tax=Nonomuraea sp. NPDC050790 TaxID=3364371 RepID=UPI0037B65213